MGSHSSKFRKQLQSGNEYAALDQYHHSSDLRKALDPNSSYGDTYQHDTPMHFASRHAMKILLRIFLYELGGNPNKGNSRNETSLHNVCMADNGLTFSQLQRRFDCLTLILQWQGPPTREGEIEKVDMDTIDEKGNTALHYAAASGLQRCVKLLVSQGAALFIENKEKSTPCDCAEKNNHADIALYLESKMVFSNESDVEELELPHSVDIEEGFSGLRAQDLQEAKDMLLVETSDMLRVPLFTAEALLRNHEWSRESLLEAWMDDAIGCCERSGVMPPSSLMDEPSTHTLNTRHSVPPVNDTICDICACDIPVVEDPVRTACEHQFCRDCWKRYLTGKILEGEAHNLTCPGFDCSILVPVDLLETLVSKDMARRYLQFDIKAFVDSNPSIQWCPFPGCARAVRLPDDNNLLSPSARESTSSTTSNHTEISHAVDCGKGHVFCWECRGEAHEPSSCEHWSKWHKEILEIKPEELSGTDEELESTANCLWLITNSKPCPNCKSPIQKNEGCNHMKCSKCKHDFCWVCMEGWKKHSSVTGGYFRCNRYEVVKKVDDSHDKNKSEAELKNKKMQELNKFVHYYTRYKNHENSSKLEDPLMDTAKEKMLVLARTVTLTPDSVSGNETKFVEDAVLQLMKARRVLKCSYVYGYYLEESGYKKPIFEFMQTELEECTEALSEMVARPYLRTPRHKIIHTSHLVQRKRHEFVSAIAKGLIPADSPPNLKTNKKKISIEFEEDLNKALLASLNDPSKAWVKDQSGKHTNLTALLDWPDSDSDTEISTTPTHVAGSLGGSLGSASTDRDSVFIPGLCARNGCGRNQVKNPRTNVYHDYCSINCMHQDKQKQQPDDTKNSDESYNNYELEWLRAVEMSNIQFIRDQLQSTPSESAHTSTSLSPRPPTNSLSSEPPSSPHPLVLLYPPRGRSPCLVLPRELPRANNNTINYETELEQALEMSKVTSQGAPVTEEEQDLRLAIELSLRDARASQNLSDHMLPSAGQNLCDHALPSSTVENYHDSDPLNDQYSSIVNRVPNKSVEDLYRASSVSSDSSHQTLVPKCADNNQAYGINSLSSTKDEEKICDFQRIIFPGGNIGDRDDQPSRYELFEPGPEGRLSSASSSAYCSGLSDMNSPHPPPRTRSDSGTWSSVCDRTTEQSDTGGASANQYEHYFFGPVDDCSQVTDDDPGPQLDAVLRTLSKLTTRLEDNSDGLDRDEMEEEDSFLENLLQNNHQSGLPPLAAGEDDSNETTSPAGGSLAPPELEHDVATEPWSQRRDSQHTEEQGQREMGEQLEEDQPVFV